MTPREMQYHVLCAFDTPEGSRSEILSTIPELRNQNLTEVKQCLYFLVDGEYIWQRGKNNGAIFRTSDEGREYLAQLSKKLNVRQPARV